MVRVKLPDDTQNRRRSGRPMASTSRSPSNVRMNKKVVHNVSSDDDEQEITYNERDKQRNVKKKGQEMADFYDRLLGDMVDDFIPLRVVRPEEEMDNEEELGTQIVPYGYCFESEGQGIHEPVVHSEEEIIDEIDNVPLQVRKEHLMNERKKQKATVRMKAKARAQATRNRPQEVERRQTRGSRMIHTPQRRKTKTTKEVEETNHTRKKKRVEPPVEKNIKNTNRGKAKLNPENYGRGNTRKSDVDMETLYEDAPLLLPRHKWSSVQKLVVYAKYETIINIKDNLKRKHLRRFESGPFGHFLNFQVSKFPTQLLYHIIRRQCSITREDELTFNFEGKIIKFGISDFEKITGLNCGQLPTLDMHKCSGRFWTKYFNEKQLIRRSELSDMFLDKNSVKKKDRVRLAKIYFLANFLLGKQVKIGVNINYIRMLDDEEQFDQYPWGRIAYMTTIESIKKAIKNASALQVGVVGFPHALIVWAFECIPSLSAPLLCCCQKVSSGMPKMNNWLADVHPEWSELARKVFDKPTFEIYEMLDEENDEGQRSTHNGESSRVNEEISEIGKKVPKYFEEFCDLVMRKFEEMDGKIQMLAEDVQNLKRKNEDEDVNEDDKEDGNEDDGEDNLNKEVDNEGGEGLMEEDNVESVADTQRATEYEEGNVDSLPDTQNATGDENAKGIFLSNTELSTFLLEVEQMEKEAIKGKQKIDSKGEQDDKKSSKTISNEERTPIAAIKAVEERAKRKINPSKLMKSPYTTEFGSTEENNKAKKVKLENCAPTFHLLSQL